MNIEKAYQPTEEGIDAGMRRVLDENLQCSMGSRWCSGLCLTLVLFPTVSLSSALVVLCFRICANGVKITILKAFDWEQIASVCQESE